MKKLKKWKAEKCVPLKVFYWLVGGICTAPFWLAILAINTKKNAVIAILSHTAK